MWAPPTIASAYSHWSISNCSRTFDSTSLSVHCLVGNHSLFNCPTSTMSTENVSLVESSTGKVTLVENIPIIVDKSVCMSRLNSYDRLLYRQLVVRYLRNGIDSGLPEETKGHYSERVILCARKRVLKLAVLKKRHLDAYSKACDSLSRLLETKQFDAECIWETASRDATKQHLEPLKHECLVVYRQIKRIKLDGFIVPKPKIIEDCLTDVGED